VKYPLLNFFHNLEIRGLVMSVLAWCALAELTRTQDFNFSHSLLAVASLPLACRLFLNEAAPSGEMEQAGDSPGDDEVG